MLQTHVRRGLLLFGLSLFLLWIGLSVRGAFANAQLWADVAESDIALQGERRILPDHNPDPRRAELDAHADRRCSDPHPDAGAAVIN